MSEKSLTPLQAAYVRGMNLAREDHKFRSCSPPANDMYRIILAAVLTAQETILERLDKQDKTLQELMAARAGAQGDPPNIPFSEPPVGEPGYPPPDIGRVNKQCEQCGVMMLNVFPARKYCDKCKEGGK